MAHTLSAGIRTGRIDADGLGSFEIENGQLEAEDYKTASDLVARYSTVEWSDGDPDEPDVADSEDGSETDEGATEDDSLVDVLPELTIPEFEDELEGGQFDGRLDAVEEAEEVGKDRDGVYDAIGTYREE